MDSMVKKGLPIVAGILVAQHVAPKVTASLPESVPPSARTALALVIGAAGGILAAKLLG